MDSGEKLRKIASGAGLLATAYLISRILGLIREMAIAWRYGARELTDLYNASFQIPDILNYLLAGGAFSIVLIPMIAKHVIPKHPAVIDADGSRIFYRILMPLTLGIIGLTLILLLLAPQISILLYPQFRLQPKNFALLVRMTRIILPAQIFFLVGGLYNAALRACGDFRGNAWGPNIYNLGIIAGALLLSPWLGIAGISVGVLAGAVVGPFIVPYLLGRKRIVRKVTWEFASTEFREYIRLSLPLMLGFSLLTVDQWFMRIFGARSGIRPGTITCLNYARTVMLVPIGLVGQAIGQASLTYLSQLWQKDQRDEFSLTFRETLRAVLFLSLLFTALLFLVAPPLVALLFRRGAFSAQNSTTTAAFLQIMVLAVPAFATQQTLVNGYYAKKETLRPMVIATLVSFLSFFIYGVWQKWLAGPGIAWASVTCLWLLFGVTLADYTKRYGRNEGFSPVSLFTTLLKGAFISVVSVGIGWLPSLSRLDIFRPADAVLLILIRSFLFLVVAVGMTLLLGGAEASLVRRMAQRVFGYIQRRLSP